jgi:hypothetical protein
VEKMEFDICILGGERMRRRRGAFLYFQIEEEINWFGSFNSKIVHVVWVLHHHHHLLL